MAKTEAENRQDRMLITSRVIDAPRELVFEAWTSPKHLAAWWGPDGFTTTTSAYDLRPGGVWRFVMHGPDGRNYENRITFDEIVRPERIVYRHGGADDVEPVEFQTLVTFEDLGGKTRITLAGEFPSKAERDRVVRDYGADVGATQTLGRLAEHVKEVGELPIRRITFVRTLDAPRALVWAAWTEPKRLQRWWGPQGFSAPRVALDPRPGGAFDVDMQAPDGTVFPVNAVVREFVPPERFSFSAWVHGEGPDDPGVETLNAVSLVEREGKTVMTVEATVVKATAAQTHLYAGMDDGWGQALEKLAASVQHSAQP